MYWPMISAAWATVAVTPYQDLRPARLNGTRHVERAIDPVVLAFEGRPLLGEHEPGDGQRFVEPVHALRDRRKLNPVAVVLVLVPRGADAEDGATARNHIKGRDHLGQQSRIAVCDPGHERAQLDPRRLSRERAQRGVRLHHRLGLRTDAAYLIEVVHHRDEVEAGRLSRPRVLDHAVEQSVARDAAESEGGHVETEERSHV